MSSASTLLATLGVVATAVAIGLVLYARRTRPRAHGGREEAFPTQEQLDARARALGLTQLAIVPALAAFFLFVASCAFRGV